VHPTCHIKNAQQGLRNMLERFVQQKSKNCRRIFRLRTQMRHICVDMCYDHRAATRCDLLQDGERLMIMCVEDEVMPDIVTWAGLLDIIVGCEVLLVFCFFLEFSSTALPTLARVRALCSQRVLGVAAAARAMETHRATMRRESSAPCTKATSPTSATSTSGPLKLWK
jgi:hypothetical protein